MNRNNEFLVTITRRDGRIQTMTGAQYNATPPTIKKPISLAQKIQSATRAMTSKFIDPPTSVTVQSIRLAVCNGCEELERDSDPAVFGYCRACGCGQHRFAALTFKATIARSTCVKNKWCDADGNPPPAPPPAT